jgi:hypothetical protein
MQHTLIDGTSTRRKRDKNTFLNFHGSHKRVKKMLFPFGKRRATNSANQ